MSDSPTPTRKRGRPVIMPERVRVVSYLTRQDMYDLQRRARDRQTSVSRLVRDLILRALGQPAE